MVHDPLDLPARICRALQGGASICAYGPPGSGKSALLGEVEGRLRAEPTNDQVVRLDCCSLGAADGPEVFWGLVLKLAQAPAAMSQRQHVSDLRVQGRRLVLLLDDFDQVIVRHQFHEGPFFEELRELSSSGGLAILLTSCWSLLGMRQKVTTAGSSFLNNFQSRPMARSAPPDGPRDGGPAAPRRVQLYLGHADQDSPGRDEFLKHLQPMLRSQRGVGLWYRGLPGAGEMERWIRGAHWVLLLLSKHYLASLRQLHEMDFALRHRPGRVYPIIYGPCDWEHSAVGGLHPLWPKPVVLAENPDDVWVRIIRKLWGLIDELPPP